MNMKNLSSNVIILVMAIFVGFFPGCIKYHKTLPTEFTQGQDKQDRRDITAQYVKTARIYEQFSTRAIFDALWLADDVRASYANLYCEKRGKSIDDTEAFVTRQREENNHWTAFYVLADVRDRMGASLSDKNAAWTFFLKRGNYKAAALSVKEIELEPEFQLLFGKQFNLFKTAYLVKFPVCGDDVENNNDKITDDVQLVIESVEKSATLTWSPTDSEDANLKKKVLHHEDFYWG